MNILSNTFVILCLAVGVIQCGFLPDYNTFIVNGTRADTSQFPYMVSIRVGGDHNCGGAIIDDRWVLTAAHCATKEFSKELLTVVARINSLNEAGDEYAVVEKIPHDEYDSSTNRNDIALLKVDRKFDFTDNKASKISVASPNQKIANNSEIFIAGWGFTKYPNSKASNELLYAKMYSLTPRDCQEKWGPKQVITYQHFCVANPTQGTCLGDSGGPYTYDDKVVAVHILGDWCALKKPSIATRVSEYLDWISENMKKFS